MGNKSFDNHIEALAHLWDQGDISCPPHRHNVREEEEIPFWKLTMGLVAHLDKTGLDVSRAGAPRARVGEKSIQKEPISDQSETNQEESQCLSACTEDFYSSNGARERVGGVGGEGFAKTPTG